MLHIHFSCQVKTMLIVSFTSLDVSVCKIGERFQLRWKEMCLFVLSSALLPMVHLHHHTVCCLSLPSPSPSQSPSCTPVLASSHISFHHPRDTRWCLLWLWSIHIHSIQNVKRNWCLLAAHRAAHFWLYHLELIPIPAFIRSTSHSIVFLQINMPSVTVIELRRPTLSSFSYSPLIFSVYFSLSLLLTSAGLGLICEGYSVAFTLQLRGMVIVQKIASMCRAMFIHS